MSGNLAKVVTRLNATQLHTLEALTAPCAADVETAVWQRAPDSSHDFLVQHAPLVAQLCLSYLTVRVSKGSNAGTRATFPPKEEIRGQGSDFRSNIKAKQEA